MTAIPLPVTRPRPFPSDTALAAAAVLLTATFVAVQWRIGRFPFGPVGSLRDFRIGVLHCLLAAYLPLAYRRVLLGAGHAATIVRASDFMGDEVAGTQSMTPPRAGIVVAVALGLVGSFFGPWLMEPAMGGPMHWWIPSGWNGGSAWHRILGLWIGPWAVLFAYAIVIVSGRLSRLARSVRLADPFDRAPLAPFVAPALGNAGLAVGLLSLYAAFALDFGVAGPVVTNTILSLGLVFLALLLPVAGLRTRVHEVKTAELAWCDEAVARERRALRASVPAASSAEPGGRLADLLAYRALVDRVSEWPFDNPALRRIALYLLLPVGSCLASTVGQELVQRYLLRH